MADDTKPDRGQWEGPVFGDPDTETIGPALTAWYALHGEFDGDPADILAWAAEVISVRLGLSESNVVNPLTPAQMSIAIKDAQLLLGMVAEIFGRGKLPATDDVALAFKATLTRNGGAGRPSKGGKLQPQSLAWWGIAREVDALIATGAMQKVAVGTVAKRLGLKDAVVAEWYRKRRKLLSRRDVCGADMENSAN